MSSTRQLADYVDLWSGEVVYVVGSSAALERFDPRFFDDKRTIAINYVGHRFGLAQSALTVTQYVGTRAVLRAEGWDGVIFEPQHRMGNSQQTKIPPDETTVEIPYPPDVNLSPRWDRTDPILVQGGTSLHPALNLAAMMGASTIITVAADHGRWNGKTNADVYQVADGSTTDRLIPKWHTETNELVSHLRDWGVAVYTMLPYVNINCEYDSFHGPRARIA